MGLYYDEGISGTKIKGRDGLQSLLEDCFDEEIDLIITKSISRFARNTTECLEMVRKLMAIGVAIYFEKENINTETMDGELMLSILSGFAESESKSISANNTWSIKKRFEEGTYTISVPALGYQNIDGQMVIDEEEKKIVEFIFQSYLDGKGSYRIANQLNDRGVKTKRGKKWSASTVVGILKNETYIGDALFQKTFTDSNFVKRNNKGEKNQYYVTGHHEPIISKESFEMVQEIMDKKAVQKGNRVNTGKYNIRYAFSSKIICGECGGVFKRKHHYVKAGSYIAWTCSTHTTNKHKCKMKYVMDDDLKYAFSLMFNKLIFARKEVLENLLFELREVDDSKVKKQIQLKRDALQKLASRKDVLFDLAKTNVIDADVYQREMIQIIKEQDQLNEGISCLQMTKKVDVEKLNHLKKLILLTSKSEYLKEFDDDLFENSVEQIKVIGRKKFEIVLKCGLVLKEEIQE